MDCNQKATPGNERMATHRKGFPVGCEVRGSIGAALREWHSHSLSEAIERRKARLALGAAFNHLQSWIDRECPVKAGL